MSNIQQVAVRNNLEPRREPYWQPLGRGRSVGFRKMSEDTEGAWLGRWRDDEARKYEYKPLGDLADVANKDRYADAVRQLEEWFQHLERGGQAGDDTVAGACAAYVGRLRRERSEDAAKDAEQRFERFINHDPIGKTELAKLRPSRVEAWRERLIARGGAPNSINRDLAPLRAALNRAKKDRKIATDFAWKESLKPLTVDQDEYRRELYLDKAQRQSLTEHASEELKPLVVAWTLLPLRPGEIAACRVQHLDTRQKMLRIPKGKTKTRDVPLPDAAFDHFRQCAKGKTPAAWLVSRADGRRWTRHMWRPEFAAAVARAKLPEDAIPYTLRHSTITDLVLAGVDIFTTAKLSGTSVAMIDRHYGKLLNEHARKALSVLSLK